MGTKDDELDEMIELAEEDMEEERWILTPWGCLYTILNNYGVDVSNITRTIGTHLVEDFMGLMVKQGHVIDNRKGLNNERETSSNLHSSCLG